MKDSQLYAPDIAVIGYGVAEPSHRDKYADRVRGTVRYADPAAWSVVGAIGQAMAPVQDRCTAEADRVGIVLISEHGPAETIAAVAATVPDGFVSPLRFAAATAGSLVGLACIVFGFHGPTLNLTMPARTGAPIGMVISRRWLQREIAKFVLIAVCQRRDERGPVARCLLLAQQGVIQPADPYCRQVDVSWLISQDDSIGLSLEKL